MPFLVAAQGTEKTLLLEEVRLSLAGTRSANRWNSIKVRWWNKDFQKNLKTFSDWTAQIIQHEMGHCEEIWL